VSHVEGASMDVDSEEEERGARNSAWGDGQVRGGGGAPAA
jgi:hypothetical protein